MDSNEAAWSTAAERADCVSSSLSAGTFSSFSVRRTGPHLFVFRGRRGSLIKVLWHDGQGICLFAKRLERGRSLWPSSAPGDGADCTVTLTPAQLGFFPR
jgi:IS66 Orf2 like protein